MVDIPSISAVVAAIGVTVGVILTVMELRNLVKARQTDLVIRLYSYFGSKEFQESWREIMTMDLSDFKEAAKKFGGWSDTFVQVGMFYEELGVLLNRKLVDIGLVDDLFGLATRVSWEQMKTVALGARKSTVEVMRGAPEMWTWFEHLYNELQKREQRLQQIQQ